MYREMSSVAEDRRGSVDGSDGRATEAASGSRLVAAEAQALAGDDVWSAPGPEADFYELTDRHAIADVLASCGRLRPDASFRLADDRACSGRMLGVHAGSDGLAVAIAQRDAPEGPCAARFEVHDVVFILHGQLRRRAVAEIAPPLRLFTLDRRSATRASLAEGRGELVWSSLDTDDPRPGRSSVRDLGPRGVGVVEDEASGPLPDAIFPAELRVGDSVIPCLAETRRRSSAPGQPSGVRIDAGGLSRTLIETYLVERMPRLAPRSSIDCDSLQKLMTESGYLGLRECEVDIRAWRDFAPRDLVSCDRVYRADDGKLLGHISATRIYRRTWLLHQLSCLRGHPETTDCRKELYLFVATVPSVYDGPLGSVVAYFDQDLRWHKLFFKRFVDWANNPALATICGFDRFERDDPWEAAEAPPGYDVREAHQGDVIEICTLVRAHLPGVTADALDIHPTDVLRPATSREERGRNAFVLRQGGKLAGVALCDTGDPNASLFNVINMAQIYLRTGRSAPSPEAQRGLLSAVRAFYARLRVQRPLVVSPTGTMNGTTEPGTRFAENMGCMVISGRGLRQWENFCRFHFGLMSTGQRAVPAKRGDTE